MFPRLYDVDGDLFSADFRELKKHLVPDLFFAVTATYIFHDIFLAEIVNFL